MSQFHAKTFAGAKQALDTILANANGTVRGSGAIVILHQWVNDLGLASEFNQLRVIHIAGTKGKGSTAAFTSSLLQAYGSRNSEACTSSGASVRTQQCVNSPRPLRVGLFTSPHLRNVRERIRINDVPVSEDVFADVFWPLHDVLQPKYFSPVIPYQRNMYFAFLTLLGLKIFADMAVDYAIVEVGMGGRLDATNVFATPAACGITALGYDHMEFLGSTIDLIAGEKAGVMKPNVPCFTMQKQYPQTHAVLQAKAAEVGTPLYDMEKSELYQTMRREYNTGSLQLGIGGEHQLQNSAIAVVLARTARLLAAREEQEGKRFVAYTSYREDALSVGEKQALDDVLSTCLDKQERAALAATHWDGRSHVVKNVAQLFVGEDDVSAIWRETCEKGTVAGGGGGAGDLPAARTEKQEKEHPSAASVGPSSFSSAVPVLSDLLQVNLFLDGAHTSESLDCAAQWYGGNFHNGFSHSNGAEVNNTHHIVFFCQSNRDAHNLLLPISDLCGRRNVPHKLKADAIHFMCTPSCLMGTGKSREQIAAWLSEGLQGEWLKIASSFDTPVDGQKSNAPGVPTVPIENPVSAMHVNVDASTDDARAFIRNDIVLPALRAQLAKRKALGGQVDGGTGSSSEGVAVVNVFVTGSLLLVGDYLRQLEL